MGPRPIFDFPDEISIPEVPLKMEQQTTLIVHNIGAVAASFSLVTKWSL